MERRQDLRFRDFSYQDLSDFDFAGADLTGANFVGAILRGADLSGVYAERANFTGADLTDALLEARERLSRPAVSPNGEYLACQGGANRLWLWDLKQQETEAPLHLPETPLLSLSFSPDSRWLVCLFSTSLLLWDVKTRMPFHHLQLLPDPNTSPYRGFWKDKALLPPVFSLNGRLLAIWMQKKLPAGPRVPCIRLWDVGQQAYVQDLLTTHQVIAFAPDTTLIATGGETLALWHRETGKQLHQWKDLGPIRELTFHASGMLLFVLANHFYALDVTTGAFLPPHLHPMGPTEPVTSSQISPGETRFLTTTNRERSHLDLWSIPDLRHIGAFEGYRATFSPDDRVLAITVNERRGKHSMTHLRNPANGQLLQSVSGWIESFSLDGFWLATATGAGSGERWLRWNCQTGQQISAFSPGHRFDTAIVSPNSQVVALFYGEEERGTIHVSYAREIDDEYSTNEGQITVYAVESGEIVCPYMAKQVWQAILQGVFSPDSRLLALEIAEYNNASDFQSTSHVEVWDVITGERLVQTFALRRKLWNKLAFDPSNGWLKYGEEPLWFSGTIQDQSGEGAPAHQSTTASAEGKTPGQPASDPTQSSLWQTISSGQRLLLQRSPHPHLMAAESILAVPETIDPRSHDALVMQGLGSEQDTWQQLLAQAQTNATHKKQYEEQFKKAFQQTPQSLSRGRSVPAYNWEYTCGVSSDLNGVLRLWQKDTQRYEEISWPTRWSDAYIVNANGIKRSDRSWMLRQGAKEEDSRETPSSEYRGFHEGT